MLRTLRNSYGWSSSCSSLVSCWSTSVVAHTARQYDAAASLHKVVCHDVFEHVFVCVDYMVKIAVLKIGDAASTCMTPTAILRMASAGLPRQQSVKSWLLKQIVLILQACLSWQSFYRLCHPVRPSMWHAALQAQEQPLPYMAGVYQ